MIQHRSVSSLFLYIAYIFGNKKQREMRFFTFFYVAIERRGRRKEDDWYPTSEIGEMENIMFHKS